LAETLQMELKPKGLFVTLVVLGNVTGTAYWEHNPGSREHLLRPYPALIPDITAEQAAKAIFDGAEERKRLVVEPWQYRVLFLLNTLFPKTTASQISQMAKKHTAKVR
jgi:short-subunit dehydrogenase